jgi:hypothetical protein
VGIMASRVSSRGWVVRDIPRTYVLLVWAAFVVGILLYFIDWSPVQRESTVRPDLHNGSNEKRYIGSIVVDSARGDMCWERILDNRTGKMWDKGYVKCNSIVSQPSETNPPEGIDIMRMRSVGKAFRHEKD